MGTLRHFAKVGQGLHLNLELAKTEFNLAQAAFMSYGTKPTLLRTAPKNTAQMINTLKLRFVSEINYLIL